MEVVKPMGNEAERTANGVVRFAFPKSGCGSNNPDGFGGAHARAYEADLLERFSEATSPRAKKMNFIDAYSTDAPLEVFTVDQFLEAPANELLWREEDSVGVFFGHDPQVSAFLARSLKSVRVDCDCRDPKASKLDLLEAGLALLYYY